VAGTGIGCGIIQDIGKATQTRVCFPYGHHFALEWDSFFRGIVSKCDRDSGADGPTRLARQLQAKYDGSHNLRSLLETHEHAECKNTRGKIYGLVGLAEDSYGFPFDYEESALRSLEGYAALPREV